MMSHSGPREAPAADESTGNTALSSIADDDGGGDEAITAAKHGLEDEHGAVIDGVSSSHRVRGLPRPDQTPNDVDGTRGIL